MQTTKKPPWGSFLFLLPEGREWCGREDSNFHVLRHSDLNAARLPIPPRPYCVVEASFLSSRSEWGFSKASPEPQVVRSQILFSPVENFAPGRDFTLPGGSPRQAKGPQPLGLRPFSQWSPKISSGAK